MALMDPTPRHRDALPSINHLDLDKAKPDGIDRSRFSAMSGLSISTAPHASPTTIYSGPPPPYSYTSSVTGSGNGQTGYISPPEPVRPPPKDDKEPRQSLPSISEALGQDKAMGFSAPVTSAPSTALAHPPSMPTPSSATGHSFPEAPVGPSNPFSQSSVGGAPKREHGSRDEMELNASSFSTLNAPEPRPQPSQAFGMPRSPKFSSGSSHSQVHNMSGSVGNAHASCMGSPNVYPPYRSPFAFSSQASNPPPTSTYTSTSDPFRVAHPTHLEGQKGFVAKAPYGQSYGESVKRHLDVFDTQIALQEIVEASARNTEFAHVWSQRALQAPRTGYFPEVLPDLQEVDEALRHASRVMENLSRVKDAVIAQQNALAEQRARTAKGDYIDDDFNPLHDDYKGGFNGGDAKKRRGKAAPPGRCHSCNRAETPEWRRGPDGARTLCNACGLHYAKLTRKMGVKKASSLAGSSLRPKNLDPRSPHQ